MIYRAFGLYAIRNNVELENELEVKKALANANITLKSSVGNSRVYINDEDVSDLIRTEQVAEVTSKAAKIELVREYILSIQRKAAEGHNVIMEGRDIGSVVFPNAELKIFLTADVEERAKRRYNELIQKGNDTTFDEVRAQIINRDKEDSTRKVSPLMKTEDMIEIDTTNLTEKQVLDKVRELINKKGLGCF